MFSIVAAPTCSPTNSVGRFSTPSPEFVIHRLLKDGYFDQCEEVLIVVLICISLINSDVEPSFHLPSVTIYMSS